VSLTNKEYNELSEGEIFNDTISDIKCPHHFVISNEDNHKTILDIRKDKSIHLIEGTNSSILHPHEVKRIKKGINNELI
jgi:hypothetical protein